MPLSANALHSWSDGERRLREAPAEQRRTLERVCERIYVELRRRLGGPFSADELVALYEQGTGWCLQLAVEVAPDSPWAWDASVADAAFGRYLRNARDYAGGRLAD
jgi:hypothetical protein